MGVFYEVLQYSDTEKTVLIPEATYRVYKIITFSMDISTCTTDFNTFHYGNYNLINIRNYLKIFL